MAGKRVFIGYNTSLGEKENLGNFVANLREKGNLQNPQNPLVSIDASLVSIDTSAKRLGIDRSKTGSIVLIFMTPSKYKRIVGFIGSLLASLTLLCGIISGFIGIPYFERESIYGYLVRLTCVGRRIKSSNTEPLKGCNMLRPNEVQLNMGVSGN